jgi:hypothetical protein
MLFCGWLFLAFFLLPTQMHERYLYYAVVLLALPAMKSRLLLAAYLVLNVVLYLNVGYTLDRFLPDTFVPWIAPHLPVALQRALAFAALAGGAAFLFAIVSSLLGRNLNGHPPGAAPFTQSEHLPKNSRECVRFLNPYRFSWDGSSFFNWRNRGGPPWVCKSKEGRTSAGEINAAS